jgi:hypothetical protein
VISFVVRLQILLQLMPNHCKEGSSKNPLRRSRSEHASRPRVPKYCSMNIFLEIIGTGNDIYF